MLTSAPTMADSSTKKRAKKDSEVNNLIESTKERIKDLRKERKTKETQDKDKLRKEVEKKNQLGQRLADECQSPAQAAVAQAMKLAPPIHLLEGGRDVARQ